MRKFDGEVSSWPTLWDAFESSIHKSPSLAPVDKFNHLNSLLMKPALDTISGLSLTASNYEEVIAILRKRFGNKQQIINRHMETFLNVSPVTNQDARKGICDILESHVGSLMGEDNIDIDILVGSDQYWSLVSGRVVRGEHGPIAIETKLGWVLLGPVPEGTQVNRQQSNIVTTHVLKSAVKPVDVTNETLDGTLKHFGN